MIASEGDAIVRPQRDHQRIQRTRTTSPTLVKPRARPKITQILYICAVLPSPVHLVVRTVNLYSLASQYNLTSDVLVEAKNHPHSLPEAGSRPIDLPQCISHCQFPLLRY